MDSSFGRRLRIFVTDGHTRAALGAVRSLGRAGHAVVVGYPDAPTGRPPSASSRFCSGELRYPAPGRSQAAFQEWLCGHAKRRTFDAVLPVSEASLVAVSAIRKKLQRGIIPIAPAESSLLYTLSKFHSTRMALTVGVPCPHTIFISDGGLLSGPDDWLSQVKFPIVIKTDNYFTEEGGYEAGRKFVARSAEQAARVVEEFRHLRVPIIAQEFLPGSGVGACLLRFQGRTQLRFAHRRLHEVPYTGGASSFRESCRDDEMVRFGERLLDAIDYDGVAMVEFRRCEADGRPYFLEINGRLWGSLALALHCGVDFPARLVACYQTGSSLGSEAPAYPSGIRCRNVYPGELHHVLSVIKGGHSTEGVRFSFRLRSIVRFFALFFDPRIRHDYFWWSDPRPGIRQSWKMFSWIGYSVLKRGASVFRAYGQNKQLRRLVAQHERSQVSERYFEGPLGRILFLCYGNICRSPFAAEYWNATLSKRMGDAAPKMPKAYSAGFHRREGRHAPEWLVTIATEYEIDLSGHRSRTVSRNQIEAADAVFVMDRENYRRLVAEFPWAQAKTFFLGWFAACGLDEITDPYGMDEVNARRCCAQLVASVEGLMDQVVRDGQAVAL